MLLQNWRYTILLSARDPIQPQARARHFLTPDSEFELSQILRGFGELSAHELW